ncbi:hypothetical protein GP486_006156 [Trichoglossum hirsutum]|uniref:Protein kinase domain-containing protein n=1 Tax=Trichoglossum hirsutum TaxID=265104 RepID=A0A9P8RKZ0_9PEZI|nr:hypothetical protein GP486_006156 [Trichoglossum hirsutum]
MSTGTEPSDLTTNAVGSTLIYAAPEVVEQARLGKKSDIFSLSCIFVELLAILGRRNVHFYDCLSAIPLWLEQLQLGKSITELVLKMTSREPSLRPSAKELFDHDLGQRLSRSDQLADAHNLSQSLLLEKTVDRNPKEFMATSRTSGVSRNHTAKDKEAVRLLQQEGFDMDTSYAGLVATSPIKYSEKLTGARMDDGAAKTVAPTSRQGLSEVPTQRRAPLDSTTAEDSGDASQRVLKKSTSTSAAPPTILNLGTSPKSYVAKNTGDAGKIRSSFNNLQYLRSRKSNHRVSSAAIQSLLDNGLNIYTDSSKFRDALLWAANLGHEEVVRLLLEGRAGAAAMDKRGGDTACTLALHHATENGHESVVRLPLLGEDAAINAKNSDGETAAKKGHEAVVRLLLESKLDVNAKGHHGQTALHWAVIYWHEATIRLLLEAKADVDVKDEVGRTVLSIAAGYGNEVLVQLFLEHKADIDAKGENRKTALSIAAEHGHEEVVKLLLEYGADVNRNRNLRLLLEHKADINVGAKEWTPLHVAAKNGNEAIVQLLPGHEVNVAKTDKGRTALLIAAEKGNVAVVRLLLEYGTDINANGDIGLVALHIAALNERKAVVRLLLEHKADINAKVDQNKGTALHLAVTQGREVVVRLLLKHKIGVNARAFLGLTALHLAAVYQAVDVRRWTMRPRWGTRR